MNKKYILYLNKSPNQIHDKWDNFLPNFEHVQYDIMDLELICNFDFNDIMVDK